MVLAAAACTQCGQHGPGCSCPPGRLRKRAPSTDSLLGEKQQLQAGPPQTVGVEDAPDWLKRPYISRGYLIGGTPGQALKATLLGFNNETLNAHTMIWSAALSTVLYWVARQQAPGSMVPFTLLWLSCTVHMPFSVGLHCTIGVSAQQRSVWRSLDFLFIFTCSVVLASAMGWYVFGSARQYATFLVASLGTYGTVVWKTMVSRRIKDIPKKEAACYVACVVACFALPMLYAAAREVWTVGVGPVTRQVASIALVLVVGGELYALHYPERLLPGRFDLLFNSHQLMHLLAMVAHYLEWRLLRHLADEALHMY
jgi:adiponectin receptor